MIARIAIGCALLCLSGTVQSSSAGTCLNVVHVSTLGNDADIQIDGKRSSLQLLDVRLAELEKKHGEVWLYCERMCSLSVSDAPLWGQDKAFDQSLVGQLQHRGLHLEISDKPDFSDLRIKKGCPPA